MRTWAQLYLGMALEGTGEVEGARAAYGKVVERWGKPIPRSITAEKAILVDDRCRTNIPEIYAAGDCAAIFDPLFNKHRLCDYWETAAITGAIAGANMSSAAKSGATPPLPDHYIAVSSFSTQLFDLRLAVWGAPRSVDRRIIRGNPNVESPEVIEIGVDTSGRVAQVAAFGHVNEHPALASLVQRRLLMNGNEERLKDPGTPLESF